MTTGIDPQDVRSRLYEEPLIKFLSDRGIFEKRLIKHLHKTMEMAINHNYHTLVKDQDILVYTILMEAFYSRCRIPFWLSWPMGELRFERALRDFHNTVVSWLQENYRNGDKPLREREEYFRRSLEIRQIWKTIVG